MALQQAKRNQTIRAFYRQLSAHYHTSGRHDMLWRKPEADGSFDPYKIMVSELMLQQTQVDRVRQKYIAFLWRFPTVSQLASAPLSDVLTLWNGLGYNRRAKYLWQAAMTIELQYSGEFPRTLEELRRLPGVGPNTAGAIMAYAFNLPVIFIETNIRTVIIHHFFADHETVSDQEIIEVMQAILRYTPAKTVGSKSGEQLDSLTSPREFYWAMMDYGSHLKKTVGNLNRVSKSYAKQSAFAGSRRQVRGEVIRLLAAGSQSLDSLKNLISDERLEEVLTALQQEQLIIHDGKKVALA